MKIFSLSFLLFSFCQLDARKPNFVYVMVDDAGYGDFSCFRQKKFKTPSVDRMAKEADEVARLVKEKADENREILRDLKRI